MEYNSNNNSNAEQERFFEIQQSEDYDDLRLLREEKAQSAHDAARLLKDILSEMAAH